MNYIPEASHWYSPLDGKPCHWQEKKDGSGTTPTTLAHAKRLGLYPSVTTVLRALAKPALTEWLCRNAATAALTTPRIDGETLDAFLERILRKDATDESEKAKDLGTRIHAVIEEWLNGFPVADFTLTPFVDAVMSVIKPLGRVVWTERILIGDGYAGKADALFESEEAITLVDFKTTKNVPKKQWWEHQLQLALYALCLGNTGNKRIRIANVYISTTTHGEVVLHSMSDWDSPAKAGKLIVQYWQIANDYYPKPTPKEFPHLKPVETKLVEPANFDVIP